MKKSEDNLVAWLKSQVAANDRGVFIGIGDDMAMLRAAGTARKSAGEFLVTADMLMDGVDFDTTVHKPEWIGRKALAASLSDCAAMAVRPRYAVVSVALPASWSMKQAQRLYRGMAKLAQRYGCSIVGGDTNSWRHPLVIDVAVLAVPWDGVRPVRRDGLRIGDAACVTGRLGGSLHGSGGPGRSVVPHHLAFEPRVREAHWLARQLGSRLHAMMDLSDGLSTDATRMAAASRCGIELDEQFLLAVASEAAVASSRADGRSVLDHVLNDGEDFELLFAVAPTGLAAIERGRWARRASRAAGRPDAMQPPEWTRIGTAIAGRGLWLRQTNGRRARIKPAGWQHFRDE